MAEASAAKKAPRRPNAPETDIPSGEGKKKRGRAIVIACRFCECSSKDRDKLMDGCRATISEYQGWWLGVCAAAECCLAALGCCLAVLECRLAVLECRLAVLE